jgi:hypothetical protein
MEYFDASEELYGSIHEFMRVHDGKTPEKVSVSPMLFQWLTEIRREEALLKGLNAKKLDLSQFPTEFGTHAIVIDEMLSDYEIIAE